MKKITIVFMILTLLVGCTAPPAPEQNAPVSEVVQALPVDESNPSPSDEAPDDPQPAETEQLPESTDNSTSPDLPADMSDYPDFEDSDHQFIQKNMEDIFQLLENKGSGILYFGFPLCPWCDEALPIMNSEAKKINEKILYVQTRDMERELLYTPEDRETLISYIGDSMDEDTDGNLQLFVPYVVVLKDGKVLSSHIGTVGDYDAHERSMTDSEQEELRQIYQSMFALL